MSALKIYSIGCVISTRLEMIKMAPIIFQLNMCSWARVYLICNSMPKRLLKEILALFNLNADYNLSYIKFRHSIQQHKETLLSYDEFIHLMQRAILILSDSENVQEEASALHKPVLILRSSTEKAELVAEGLGLLVGTSKKEIIRNVNALLTDGKRYLKLTQCPSPYGDGHAAERITDVLKKHLLIKNKPSSTHFKSENS